MYKHLFIAIFSFLFLVSCGSKKAALGEISDDAAASVIKSHYQNETDFKTITGRLRVNYQDADRSQSVTVSFRMEKDETIWMSAQLLGIPLAKVLVTPTRVSYFEKISKTYFDGDFSLLSKWLGTPLDFDKLQNLLIGQSIYDLRDAPYSLEDSQRGYQLLPVSNVDGIKKMFLLDPTTYKATAQQLAQENENRNVTITYSQYQKINNQDFPQDIKIIANDGGESTQIDISYRSLTFNEPVTFPFEIPSGYEEILVE